MMPIENERSPLADLDVEDAELLRHLPNLLGYLQQVGAKAKSFRKFIIEGEFSYGRQRLLIGEITISGDGAVVISGNIDPPTPNQLEVIEAEIKEASWPHSTFANPWNLPSGLSAYDASVFKFMSQDGKQLPFVQQRIDSATGSKFYLPWSFWSDGKWRRMEPDGLLPLYGLERLEYGGPIFLHEGAKAARYVAWMTATETREAREAFDAHPWASDLSHAAHIGWIGGAGNPERTDFSPLRMLPKDRQIIVIADHDMPGEDAVSKISALLRRSLSAVRFDDRFPARFDLADPWPREVSWWQSQRYVGPMIDEFTSPATWATKRLPQEGRGAPRYEVRDEFMTEWYMSQVPQVFIHRKYPSRLLSPEAFNLAVKPFSNVEDTARLLADRFPVQANGVAYRPHRDGQGAQILTVDGERLINTFRPSTTKSAAGDIGHFLEFMAHLVPDEIECHHVKQWCATLIARPEIRMQYALLLISETQGVGKTTLASSILAPLVGWWNVSCPTEQQITGSKFNGWSAHKRLAIISEIYSGQSRKCYDGLKAVITDDMVEVEQKYREPYKVENFVHIIASSNSMQALHLDAEDRRFLVPRVTEQKKPSEYWKSLNAWLNNGGLAIIAFWADGYVKQHGPVEKGSPPPATTAKDQVIAEARSEGARMVYDLAQTIIEQGEKVVLRLDEVREFVAQARGMNLGDMRLEKQLTLRKALIAGGMKQLPSTKAQDRRIAISGRPTEVVATFDVEPGTNWAQISVFHRKPGDLIEM